MIRWFRFVVHERVDAYKRVGWVHAADLGPTHGTFAVLMEWVNGGEPVEP